MDAAESFKRHFFKGEVNRMVGSGGEIIVKSEENRNRGKDTVIEPGDVLIGIGITHLVESMERTPGPDSVRFALVQEPKAAARAFACAKKEQFEQGYRFRFEPLPPLRYCELLDELSNGGSNIQPDSVPEGTMILSFILAESRYSLERSLESSMASWRAVLAGERHWNVGIAAQNDFWAAEFPHDDVGLLREMDPWTNMGRISFGLSMLEGSKGALDMGKVQANHPDGRITEHNFHLSGQVSGTRGLDTDFYIGLRTQILCKPEL